MRPIPLKCAMESVALAQAPRFLALSYLWGDASTAHEIVLNGNKLPVATNLHLALVALRRRVFGDSVLQALGNRLNGNAHTSHHAGLCGHLDGTSLHRSVLPWRMNPTPAMPKWLQA